MVASGSSVTRPVGGTMTCCQQQQQHSFSSFAPGNHDEVFTGRVKFYNRKKCYGFVIPDNQLDLQVYEAAVRLFELQKLALGIE